MNRSDRATRWARWTAAVMGVAVTTVGLTACLTDSSPTGSGSSTVPVSISVALPRQISMPERPPTAFDFTVNDGVNEIALDQIELVIRDLTLRPEDVSSCGAGDCFTYVEGPATLPLPTEGGALRLTTVQVEVARYDGVNVSLYAPSAGDAVLDENPEFEGVSLRAEGTYNGEPFTFETDVTADFRMTLSPAVVLESGGLAANVTILVGVTGWFVEEGSGLIDPRTANEGGENEALVESNIQDSFDAFRDDDLDGVPGSSGS